LLSSFHSFGVLSKNWNKASNKNVMGKVSGWIYKCLLEKVLVAPVIRERKIQKYFLLK